MSHPFSDAKFKANEPEGITSGLATQTLRTKIHRLFSEPQQESNVYTGVDLTFTDQWSPFLLFNRGKYADTFRKRNTWE